MFLTSSPNVAERPSCFSCCTLILEATGEFKLYQRFDFQKQYVYVYLYIYVSVLYIDLVGKKIMVGEKREA
jgi:hypothetical protein